MLSEILTNEMQPKIFNQTRLLANLMTKGVSKSLTRSGGAAERFDDGGVDFGSGEGVAGRNVCEAHERMHEGELARRLRSWLSAATRPAA
jgi:hypothetical protein